MTAIRAGFRTVRVLFVDDDAISRNATAMQLTCLGCGVVECSSGQEALAHFQSDPAGFDVVVTDIDMPNMDGHELIARLRAGERSCPPILAYSGAGWTADTTAADQVLAKPARMNELRQAIEDTIACATSNCGG